MGFIGWVIIINSAAYTNPNSRLGIIFLPGISFTMEQLVPALVAFDILGLVLRWRLFDHGAHLVGAGFGYFYTVYGLSYWNQVQKYLWEHRK